MTLEYRFRNNDGNNTTEIKEQQCTIQCLTNRIEQLENK